MVRETKALSNRFVSSNIMEALGYYREDVSSVSLEVLEEALEQSIAAIFWRGTFHLSDT